MFEDRSPGASAACPASVGSTAQKERVKTLGIGLRQGPRGLLFYK